MYKKELYRIRFFAEKYVYYLNDGIAVMRIPFYTEQQGEQFIGIKIYCIWDFYMQLPHNRNYCD